MVNPLGYCWLLLVAAVEIKQVLLNYFYGYLRSHYGSHYGSHYRKAAKAGRVAMSLLGRDRYLPFLITNPFATSSMTAKDS